MNVDTTDRMLVAAMKAKVDALRTRLEESLENIIADLDAEFGEQDRLDKDISVRAYFLWQMRQEHRRTTDWLDAGSVFMTENTGRWPNHAEHEQMAERLYAERCEARALEDWLDAHDSIMILRSRPVS